MAATKPATRPRRLSMRAKTKPAEAATPVKEVEEKKRVRRTVPELIKDYRRKAEYFQGLANKANSKADELEQKHAHLLVVDELVQKDPAELEKEEAELRKKLKALRTAQSMKKRGA